MPHLDKYDKNDSLQFQMGVPKVIEDVKIKKESHHAWALHIPIPMHHNKA